MANKRKNKKLLKIFSILLLLVISIIGGWSNLPTFADTATYTSVITDLQKDSKFKISEYPEKANDYTIQVIQIAESADGELFAYTYQPCQNTMYLVATEINMSLQSNFNEDKSDNTDGNNQGTDGNQGGNDQSTGGSSGDGFGGGGGRPRTISNLTTNAAETKPYSLTLLNTSGVFGKYKVNDFTVSKKDVRYYNITSIYRDWVKGIDKEPSNGNEINAVSFPVGKLFTAITETNGEVTYAMQKTEVITITDKRVGKLRYTDGFYLYGKESCDSHYVAFSTDKQIDTLYEADIEYMSQYIYRKGYEVFGTHTVIITEDKSEAEPHKEFKTLTYTDKASNDGNGLFGHKYTWKRIESVADFIKNEDLTDEAKADLRDKQWVLRFTETAFNFSNLSSNHLREYTEISEVTVLRLKFETSGKVYNLGVVDNKQTGNRVPDNNDGVTDEFNFWEYIWNCLKSLFTGIASGWQKFVAIAVIIVVVIVVVIAVKFVKWVIKGLFK